MIPIASVTSVNDAVSPNTTRFSRIARSRSRRDTREPDSARGCDSGPARLANRRYRIAARQNVARSIASAAWMLNSATATPPTSAPTTDVRLRAIWWIALPACSCSGGSTSGISPCAVGLVADDIIADTAPSATTGQICPAAANGIIASAQPPRIVSTTDNALKPGMRSSIGAEMKPPSA